MKVTLREKPLKENLVSLFLDININGKRTKEYLKLYILEKPKTPEEKKANKETLELAESIRAKRLLQLQDQSHGFKRGDKGGNFIEYFKKLTDDRKETKSNYDNWDSTYKHLIKFTKNNPIPLTFNEVTEEWLNSFKAYLLKEVSQNSAFSYFNKVKAALNTAFETRIINDNPAKRVKSVKQAETRREYLTIDELRRLAKEDCKYPILKTAFLFSALTGLRWSDIQKLTWGELHFSNDGGHIIHFQQKKTDGIEYLPISEQAYRLLGEPGPKTERVFKGLKYSAWHNLELAKWVMRADIKKNITFHCARHSFATLQISQGTDIYTVSKLLGHRELKTTQIYAKIVDNLKTEAVNRIPDISI